MSTTNDLNYKISVMQAAAAGKQIECRERCPVSDKWLPNDSPIWNWDEWDYRVKIEPKIIYVTRYADGGLTSFNTAAAEKRNADLCRTHRPGSVVASERYIQDLNYKPE